MSLKDLTIWLGKYVGVNLTHTAKIEEYMAHALVKMAHSSASRLGKCLHETAQTKDHLNCQKQWLIESMKLDSELLMISLTTQLSAMTCRHTTSLWQGRRSYWDEAHSGPILWRWHSHGECRWLSHRWPIPIRSPESGTLSRRGGGCKEVVYNYYNIRCLLIRVTFL